MIETVIALAMALGVPFNGKTIKLERPVVEKIKQEHGLDATKLVSTATFKVIAIGPKGSVELILWNPNGI